MNRKGFTLIEFLGCMALLGVILAIGLYTTRGTLSTTLSTLTDVSMNQIFDASRSYILENRTTWINDGEEYTCVTIQSLVNAGYFDNDEVITYKDDVVKIIREARTKVITDMDLVSECN